MKIIKKWELCLLFGLVVTILLSNISFAAECKTIRKSVLRLHILANSDSDADQKLKLQVRDRLLKEGGDLFSGLKTEEAARTAAKADITKLQTAAEDEIKKQGYSYPVKVEVAKSYFNTRTYDTVTLPAGEYEAVRVLIGNAEGHNWWCVMFPPMCLPAAEPDKKIEDVLSQNGTEIVENKPKYEIRFKTVELIEGIMKNF